MDPLLKLGSMEIVESSLLGPDETVVLGNKINAGSNIYQHIVSQMQQSPSFEIHNPDQPYDSDEELKPLTMLLDEIIESLEDKVDDDLYQDIAMIVSQIKHRLDDEEQVKPKVAPYNQTVIQSFQSPFMQDFKVLDPVINEIRLENMSPHSMMRGTIDFTCHGIESVPKDS